MSNAKEFDLNKIENIVNKYQSKISEIESIKKEIEQIRARSEDEYLYLGVIGAFSSGKSTFINSVLGKNILPTDAVQGTTVTASVLKRATYEDLEIKYWSGEVLRYSEQRKELENRYLLEAEEDTKNGVGLSWFRKILRWLGFDKEKEEVVENRNSHIRDIYKKITSTEEIAEEIEFATYYVNNENIGRNIALVDTPGTESLNARHSEVTKNAIDHICDALVVIIPYDEPVSEDLIAYVEENIEEYKKKCIFVVTKVELLDDQEELPRLIQVIYKRLKNGLGIEHPTVIPMPTFLHLKQVDQELNTTFLDDIEEDTKQQLLSMYDEGIGQLYYILSEQRSMFIKERMNGLCSSVIKKLKAELGNFVEVKNRRNKELTEKTVKPLAEFESEISAAIQKILEKRKGDGYSEAFRIVRRVKAFGETIIDHAENSTSAFDISKNVGVPDFGILENDILEIVAKFEAENTAAASGLLEKIYIQYLDVYQICGVSGTLKGIDVIFNLEEINEKIEALEYDFTERMSQYIYEIEASRKGIFRQIKNLISDPSDKLKSMVVSGVTEIFENYGEGVGKLWRSAEKRYFLDLEAEMQEITRTMISDDRRKIESYIFHINSEIDNNLNSRERVMDDIRLIEEQQFFLGRE